jgi:3-oxoacyl-[acyl-carrier protein] reductase
MIKENGIALVTGGSMGIGSAICVELARAGFDVALTYRKHEKEALEIARMVEAEGQRALTLQADVSDYEAAQQTVGSVVQSLGGLHILINNAGINWDGVIWKMTEEQWDAVLDTDLKGYFNFIRAVGPIFREQRRGRIVNITSINGLRGKFGQSNYAAAKAGIIGLTKSVAIELGKYGITVNAVAPGMVRTDMARGLPPEILQKAIDETLLKRIAEPEDVAAVVVFLCQPASRHITGEVIKVDGGQYL